MGIATPPPSPRAEESRLEFEADDDVNTLGLSFAAFPPGYPEVIRVKEGSWAESVGIQVGYVLCEVNGEDLEEMSKGVFLEHLKARPLILYFERASGGVAGAATGASSALRRAVQAPTNSRAPNATNHTSAAATNGYPGGAAVEVQARFGERIPCTGRRDGEFKKVPSRDFMTEMKSHTRSCSHAGCGHVWNGPWGSFIGGANGTTHFDLTECPEGKRLNQLTGWNYDDPRC